MKSQTTESFREALSQLPPEIQERAQKAFALFEADPRHPSLRMKRVHSSRPIYSARVSLSYRALAVQQQDTWIWFWIGSHTDYDALLKQL